MLNSRPPSEALEAELPAARQSLEVQRWQAQSPPGSATALAATAGLADCAPAWQLETREDWVAEEVPIALEFNGIAYATMLATPADLDDFARGFALSEGLVEHPREIYGVDIEPGCDGVVVQVEIATARAVALRDRRRALAGRTGCGLCGVESLSQVTRPVRAVTPPGVIRLQAVLAAQQAMGRYQALHQATGATHAAALAQADGTVLCVREDVGRHNALDKLIGATCPATGMTLATAGMVIVSSRASFEMVQKTLAAGHYLLAAVSAPTAMAVRLAQAHGLILLGFVRPGQATVYAGAEFLQP